MESLDKDRDFLKQGGVFSDDQIDAFIALKFEEIYNLEHTPHPMEFEMYYSVKISYFLLFSIFSSAILFLLIPFLIV